MSNKLKYDYVGILALIYLLCLKTCVYILYSLYTPSGVICQSQTGPGLYLDGEELPNNGFVSSEDVGEEDVDALLCTTDLDSSSCCSDRVPGQQWIFPNGTRVPLRGNGWTFWTSYGAGVIRLHRRSQDSDQIQGLFRCQIPNRDRVSLTLYVGIYSTNESKQRLYRRDLK